MWCLLNNSLDIHTEKDHASKDGAYIKDIDHRWKKKYAINVARDACPDGKEYLSGPIANGSSLEVGRLLRMIAFITATEIMSSNKPEIIFLFIYYIFIYSIWILSNRKFYLPIRRFTCIWHKLLLLRTQINMREIASQGMPWHDTYKEH